jgi:predicted transcriptional regulator
MEVQLTPEQEIVLRELAKRSGREAEDLAQSVLALYVEHEVRFVETIRRGLDSLDRGEFVRHEDVGARIDRLFPA